MVQHLPQPIVLSRWALLVWCSTCHGPEPRAADGPLAWWSTCHGPWPQEANGSEQLMAHWCDAPPSAALGPEQVDMPSVADNSRRPTVYMEVGTLMLHL